MELAIIGAGAATVCLLDALASEARRTQDITIYEPSTRRWRGRPYQPDSPAVRVNAPPEEMSIRAGDPHHFQRWLETHAGPDDAEIDPWSGDRFVARARYGDYLEHAAHDAIDRLRRRGSRVTIVCAAVTRMRQTASGVELCTTGGGHHTADRAVLCVGGDRPSDPYGLAGTSGFIADPYPTTDALAGLDPDDRVTILGTGLTAVDIVLALEARGHRGPITMASRHGALPAVRQRHVPHDLAHFTPERLREWAEKGRQVALAELVALMHTELVAAGQRPSDTLDEVLAVSGEDPVPRLRRHLEAATSTDLGLRILQRAVPDSGQDVWHVLTELDRKQVMSAHFRTVMNLCCPVPPSSAATVLRLLDDRRLDVVGGVRAVEPRHGDGFDIHADRDVVSDVVVNAINAPPHRIPRAASSLVSSLTDARLAEHHPHGGLAIERETSRLTVDGVPQPRLFALGDLTFGALFFTFGIPVLVDRSVDIAHTLATTHHTHDTKDHP